jgi:hypothetical protein
MISTLHLRFFQLLRLQRGQAMAEYSMTVFMLCILGGAGALTGFAPTFMNAFNSYLHGIQMIFNLPFP